MKSEATARLVGLGLLLAAGLGAAFWIRRDLASKTPATVTAGDPAGTAALQGGPGPMGATAAEAGELGGCHSLLLAVAGEPTDLVVDRLNQRLRSLPALRDLRNVLAPAPGFAIVDGRVRAGVGVLGDDWDLANLLRAAVTLSAAEPERLFSWQCDGQQELLLQGGRFGIKQDVVDRFLARMARPRPELEGVFRRLELTLPGPPGLAQRAVLAELDPGALRLLGAGPLRLHTEGGALRTELALDGQITHLLRVLHQLRGALVRGSPGRLISGTPVTLKLSGTTTWTRPLRTLSDWAALEHQLRLGRGPARLEQSSQGSALAVQSQLGSAGAAGPPLTTGALGNHTAAAGWLGGEPLAWTDRGGHRVRLGADGTLERLEREPALTSADGRWVHRRRATPQGWVLEVSRPDGSEARELPRGETDDPGQAGPLHALPPLAVAFVGEALLVSESAHEAVGRSREVLALHPRDGQVRRSRPHYNQTAFALAPANPGATGGRAFLSAAIDGRSRLVTVALPELTEEAAAVWPEGLQARTLLALSADEVLAVVGGTAAVNHDSLEVWRVMQGRGTCLATLSGFLLAAPVAAPGALWLALRRVAPAAGETGARSARDSPGRRRGARPPRPSLAALAGGVPHYRDVVVRVDLASGALEEVTRTVPMEDWSIGRLSVSRGRALLTFARRPTPAEKTGWALEERVVVIESDGRHWEAHRSGSAAPQGGGGPLLLDAALSESGRVAVLLSSGQLRLVREGVAPLQVAPVPPGGALRWEATTARSPD